ncbi:hypothetical protein HPB47_002519 [Ixodes persulcatus]|uniref:Uncharacterized protein n=1 Tax=Ixodes persulcatus TaxID=34615 RepID=A0AC60PM33_IXOPE|nr:hypothetical protein HPB47_002519 [Ixodes persulcatus]
MGFGERWNSLLPDRDNVEHGPGSIHLWARSNQPPSSTRGIASCRAFTRESNSTAAERTDRARVVRPSGPLVHPAAPNPPKPKLGLWNGFPPAIKALSVLLV